MTYHPLSGQPCSALATDDSAMNIYTSFVADETAVRAKVYMMGRAVNNVSTIETYALGRVCENFPKYCLGSTVSYVSQVVQTILFSATEEKSPWWGDRL